MLSRAPPREMVAMAATDDEQTMVEPPRIPRERSCPWDPPDGYGEARDTEGGLTPLTHADGHVGWLATSFDLARSILQDRRFSSRPETRHSAVALVIGDGQPPEEEVPGMFVGMDAPDHTRFRGLLAPLLSVRRVRDLEPSIREKADRLIDAMHAKGAPTDLVTDFAQPLPTQVVCELLGIAYQDWERMHGPSQVMLSTTASEEEVKGAYAEIFGFLAEVVEEKLQQPGDDLLSELIEADELTPEELTAVAFQLFTAGHETTSNMISLGMYLLLSRPDLRERLLTESGMLAEGIEELLRYLTVIQFGISRGALEDVELGGTRIEKGQTVTISLAAANRDPDRFPNPDVIDIDRASASHVAFGYGAHQCIAQQLARAELRVAYTALLQRFPDMALAVSEDSVEMRDTEIIYGVRALPVTWKTPS